MITPGELKLKPIIDREAYASSAEHLIMFWLQENIFKPLYAIIKGSSLRQAAKTTLLERALQSGEILYADNYFTGTFNAALSKELRGLKAEFDRTRKAFKLPLADVPVELRTYIVQGKMRQLKIEEEINKKLVEMSALHPEIDFKRRALDIMADLTKQFTRVITPAALEVPVELSPGALNKLQDAYHENMNDYLQEWTGTALFRLRSKVSDAVAQGLRAETLAKTIQSEFEVSRNKARFLARQETAMLVSAYRENRFTEAGIDSYIWRTSHDERVRVSHRALDGKTFKWDDPPVVDPATGQKGNPGEPYNCRCIAIPVIHIKKGMF